MTQASGGVDGSGKPADTADLGDADAPLREATDGGPPEALRGDRSEAAGGSSPDTPAETPGQRRGSHRARAPHGSHEPAGPPASSRRFREVPLVLVLAAVAFGLVVVGLDHFKRGTVVVAVALLLAAGLRLALPERAVGLLAVRNRAIDVLVLCVLGVALGADAILVPPP